MNNISLKQSKVVHHIFKGSSVNTTPQIIRDIFENANLMSTVESQHKFYIFDHISSEYNCYESNIKTIKNYFQLFSLLRGNKSRKNRIIIHGNPSPYLWEILLFSGNLENIAWVSWGHGFKYASSLNPITKLHKYAIDIVIPKLHSATMNMYSDYSYMKKKYEFSNIFESVYYTPRLINLRDKPIISNHLDSSKVFGVLVGTNASKANNHYLALHSLQTLKNENIKVFCPLSYNTSDEQYVESVILEGRKLYGNKFFPFQILSYRDDYQIYLRHYTEGTTETVMYFLPKK